MSLWTRPMRPFGLQGPGLSRSGQPRAQFNLLHPVPRRLSGRCVGPPRARSLEDRQALDRTLAPHRSISPECLVDAMKRRWGRAYACSLDGSDLVISAHEAQTGRDLADLVPIMEALDRYGAAHALLEYLTDAPELRRDPATMPGRCVRIGLNLPSGPRLCEWI